MQFIKIVGLCFSIAIASIARMGGGAQESRIINTMVVRQDKAVQSADSKGSRVVAKKKRVRESKLARMSQARRSHRSWKFIKIIAIIVLVPAIVGVLYPMLPIASSGALLSGADAFLALAGLAELATIGYVLSKSSSDDDESVHSSDSVGV